MKRKIVFATNNSHKLHEIRRIIGDKIDILSLADIDCHEELPETSDTIAGNARQKARYVKEHYGYDCFADDTGLCVEALGGAPGIYTARYAGDNHDSEANMNLLLKNLEGKDDRRAYFLTVIALAEGDEIRIFEGRVDGMIAREKSGMGGFGYDPVFIPENETVTFAEMDEDDKNSISHRGRATAKLLDYIGVENK
ncbi:MAG: non-canonical purine NTP diphosphatase [Paramuribaculum sp.]|nr:non-canonical purine NTP diphosphatase [Paramuribaculum sp.]